MSAHAIRTLRPHLTPEAARYVDRDPQQAERVVARALEVAATSPPSDGDGPTMEEFMKLIPAPAPLPSALQRFVVPRPADPNALTVTEAAKALDVSRTTLYAWIETNQLIAFRLTEKVLGIPAEQILGHKKIVLGIDRVLEVIPDSRVAWEFLTQELSFFENESQRPIDVLKRGDLEAVIMAAHAYGEAFS